MDGIIPFALLKKAAGYATRAETAASAAEDSATAAAASAAIAQNLSQTVYMDSSDGLFYIDVED